MPSGSRWLGRNPASVTVTSRRTAAFGRQAASRREGVQAVAHELLGRDIIPDVTGLSALDQQVSDHVAQLLLRSDDVLTLLQQCRQFGAVMLVVLVGNGARRPRAQRRAARQAGQPGPGLR